LQSLNRRRRRPPSARPGGVLAGAVRRAHAGVL